MVLLALASCGSPSQSGSDVLRLVNPLNAQITVTVGFPDGSTQAVALPTSGLAPERIMYTHYVFGDIYTFDATAPGVSPATTTRCAVTQLATMTGAADVQFYVQTGTTFITIACDYDAYETSRRPRCGRVRIEARDLYQPRVRSRLSFASSGVPSPPKLNEVSASVRVSASSLSSISNCHWPIEEV